MIDNKDIYLLLGELLHLCQRIEWTMKYMVEQACREVKFKNPEELCNKPPLELKWDSNSDTLGIVVKNYLQKFYGEQVEDPADDEFFKFQVKFNFNSDNNEDIRAENRKKREQELAELVSVRNFLAHQFGLLYPLFREDDCVAAMTYLEKAKAKLQKHAVQLNCELKWLVNLQEIAKMPAMQKALVLQILKGNIGKLKSYDFSNMANRTIYDYVDQNDIIEVILYNEKDKSPEACKMLPIETRLAHLQFLAELSNNQNFMEAVQKQLRKFSAKL